MEGFWKEWLLKNGLEPSGERRASEDAHLEQISALREGSALACLDTFALIRVEGEDAAAFLQGQLSSDIRELLEGRAQYSTYSTAKGRMLASFLAWFKDGAYYLMVSADIAEAIAKRLKMFVLRSKVKVELAADWALLGLAGDAAGAVLREAQAELANVEPLKPVFGADFMAMALPGAGWLVALRNESEWGGKIAGNAALTPISAEAWQLRDIQAGIVWVALATQEQFVPQMANMELIGAVNFKKGCYPGQEIVARSQYLGKMKRRMFRVEFDQALPNATKLYSPELPDQSVGMLAAVCQVGKGRYQGLAVVQAQTWESGVFGDELHKIPLRMLDLPYSLESVTG
ncbi:folate-binding protein YgfZ [Chromobacterium sp. IIBBL 290-4]|uniref:CAF17-like 4Fe-4S cluster assembly/insertion protein YgfZ n=1 Tax=Chromobacterium sp. IIBBL 290-4 TaxID=2953890 RepID=UPI0020B70819|nr:hypothetical protein [Chromobacterium sp. IIBBL 290-4]UTH74726.1 hypothetical protein NKT35_01010 [Chromobacterium sp. IIBBL 290-4]